MVKVVTIVIATFIALPVAHAEAPVSLGDGGRLEYRRDEHGNRVPDFSYCGYRGGEPNLPQVKSRIVVRPSGQDDTERIQAAIDFVSQLPVDKDGLRGAVLLGRGEFQVSGQVRIGTSGVVLRGHGAGEGGTIIRATGCGRRPLIRVLAKGNGDDQEADPTSFQIINDSIPVGATRFRLSSTKGISVGMRVEVTHRSSKAWIDKLGIDRLGWREGTRDIRWERTITAVDGRHVELDAPLTLAIDARSQTTVQAVTEDSRLKEIGIEDLALFSDFDERNPQDEEHAWYGIHVQGVQDSWVSRVQFRHFAGGAVMLGDHTSRMTVNDCASFEPISEVGGYRRHTFFTLGQQCLFLRCWSEGGLHDFSVGHCAAGPNAFVNCYAKNALGDSGPRESCATGVLYDNVRIEGHDLNLMNRWNSPTKAGWSAMNCLLWQCQAANVRCDNPPVGDNWVIGLWANPAGDGSFANLSEFIKPLSLYQHQLKERVGDEAAKRVGPFLLNPVGATNPSVEQAREFTEQSRKPSRRLIDLIREKWDRFPAGLALEEARGLTGWKPRSHQPTSQSRLMIEHGWLTINGKLLTGDHYTPMWWRGDLLPERAKEMGPAITRFAPGRYGTGLTDDLEEVAHRMTENNIVGYDHHYGLWYDRRRDDHLMVRRADGEVVPPFYAQPFARSGEGTAWDGLSRYDLTKFNQWYWTRLSDFAALGEDHGFVLFHNNYFQHNILEAGAHWSDSPWRPANHVNSTGLPEPPPYVGDKRIFLAAQFYDVSNPQLRKIHRRYIRQCLDNFAGQHNVIQLTSGEFTGPLSFMQFWIDTIAEWKKETGNEVIVALSCSKDVQDAILEDSKRSRHVDVVDVRYWTYTEDGDLYAPLGGQPLSPRQHLRQLKPASTSFESIVRSIHEYRQKFPDKAVTYNAHIHCRVKRDGWAILMGGGSLPNVADLPDELRVALVRMKPHDRLELGVHQWGLSNGDRELLVFSNSPKPTDISLPSKQPFEWATVDVNSGSRSKFTAAKQQTISIGPGRGIVWARKINR